ncbi:unnamed protein product [Adineta ricciae]|uniref:DUF4855 domain-containing protein n=1 Tax=Adineta ricciae TaxID=249248 RepID=A0A813QEH3_ADIRI|nr:unnamed protein product [Adineta ricciae]
MMNLINTIIFLLLTTCIYLINATEIGYPTIEQAGFHHNALLYIDGIHSPEKLIFWLTGSYDSLDSRRVIFDTVTIIVERTPFNSVTAYSTNKQDWSWFLETKLAGEHGILSNLTQALNRLEPTAKPLQVVVMLPYVDPVDQQAFSSTLNLANSNHRQQAIQWYVQTVKDNVERYPKLNLWGIYLMREDISLGINEEITREISAIVHSYQLRLLWIPYTSAVNWNNWSKLGIDVAILQPGYAFTSPLMQGTFNAGRVRATAKLAQKYGLGVEIESNQGASTEYEIGLLQNYLAQGFIDGYQFAPTAYFLGNYDTIARSKRACDLLRNYTSGQPIQPTFLTNLPWSWTSDPTLQATINVSALVTPQAVRIKWSSRHRNWLGNVKVEGYIEEDHSYVWKLLSSTEVGEKNWRDEDWTSTLLPFTLLSSQKILSIRISFTSYYFIPLLTNEDLVIEQMPNGIALQTSTGAPYRIIPSMYTYDPQYGDSTSQTLSNFHRGLLTDKQWSSAEWQSTMSIGWINDMSTHPYIRIAIDFGEIMHIDQILVRTHGGTSASVNWPNMARLLISMMCIPFSSYSSTNCPVRSYPCTDRVITGGTDTNQGGILSFTFSNTLRWATLEFQSNGWLMIDEIQAFVNGRDVSNFIQYYLLTPPTSKPSTDGVSYPDNGIRLTDGVIAGIMGPLTGWTKGESRSIIVDLLNIRTIRETSVWALIQLDWAISPPSSVIVSTSLDGKTWDLFGRQGQMRTGERVLDAQRLFLIADQARQARYVKFDFPIDQLTSGWWTMLSEVSATD